MNSGFDKPGQHSTNQKNKWLLKTKGVIRKLQSDMFDNMSIIVLTQIHKSFVHFFGIGSVSSYFL